MTNIVYRKLFLMFINKGFMNNNKYNDNIIFYE